MTQHSRKQLVNCHEGESGTGGDPLQKDICNIQILVTDIQHLNVIQDSLAVHRLEVNALNVEEDMDLRPSIKFLTHNTGRRLLQLEGRLVGNGCSLRSKLPHQEIRRWHEGKAWRFAGEWVTSCKASVVSLGLLE